MSNDVPLPHFDGLPLAELHEELQVLDAVIGVSFGYPIGQRHELHRLVVHVMTKPFFADCKVLLSVVGCAGLLLFSFDHLIVHNLQIVWVWVLLGSLVVFRLLQVQKLVNIHSLLLDKLDVFVQVALRLRWWK